MPYIECDGTTYSRYDTSKYVQDCIEAERDSYTKAYQECSINPECLARREARKVTNNFLITAFIICIFVIMVLTLKVINGDGNDKRTT